MFHGFLKPISSFYKDFIWGDTRDSTPPNMKKKTVI